MRILTAAVLLLFLPLLAEADYPIWIEKDCSADLCSIEIKMLTLSDKAILVLGESAGFENNKPRSLKSLLKDRNIRTVYKNGFSYFRFSVRPSTIQVKIRVVNDKGELVQQASYSFTGSTSGYIQSKDFSFESLQIGLGAGVAFNAFKQTEPETAVNYSSFALPTLYGEFSYQLNKSKVTINQKITPGVIKSDIYESKYTWKKTTLGFCQQHFFQRTLWNREVTLDLCGRFYSQSLSYFLIDSINETFSKKGIDFLGFEPAVYLRASFLGIDEVLFEFAPSLPFSFSPKAQGIINYSGGIQLREHLSSRISFGIHWFGDWINFRVGDSKLSVFNSTVEPRFYYTF